MKVFHNFDETFYKTNIKFWYLKKTSTEYLLVDLTSI